MCRYVQSVRSPRTIGLMAAIQGGTAPLTSLSNDWIASPERPRSLGRNSGAHMRLSKAAGDMYADSVLSSSPMLAFKNMVHANKEDVCKGPGEGMPGQRSKPSGSLSPCCAPVAPLSQLRHQFDGYSENRSIRANTGAVRMGQADTCRHSSKPEPAAPCQRLSRSLSTPGMSRKPYLQPHQTHSPSGVPCKVSWGMISQASRSLSPGRMRPAAHTLSVPAGRKADSHGAIPILFNL